MLPFSTLTNCESRGALATEKEFWELEKQLISANLSYREKQLIAIIKKKSGLIFLTKCSEMAEIQ